MTSVSEESFEKALDKIRELSREKRDLLEALELLVAYAKGDEGLLVDEPLLKGIEAIQKAKS